MLRLTAYSFDNEVLQSASPVIVMFYANWCSKCAMMKPIVEQLEKNYRSQIKFCKIDIDKESSLSSQYEIDIVPAFLFFENGQFIAYFAGLVEESAFSQRIKKIFRNC